MSYVLGIDLGTSSLKGVLVNRNGEVIETTSSPYSLQHLQQGYSEQRPNDWIRAFEQVIKKLSEQVSDFSEQLAGISISGQMHSLVLLDEAGEVLRPAILWNDTRTTKQCQQVSEELGEELFVITKNDALEGFTLPKILWIQQNEPEVWQKVRHILLPKDYLGYYLTGTYHSDYSDAAGTLLFDVGESCWSEQVASKFKIPLDYLPEVVDSSQAIGNLRDELATMFQLKQEVTIFAGGADNACAAVGAGILTPEVAMVSIGTSGVFLTYEGNAAPNYQGKLHCFNHAIPANYYSMGVTLTAGYSLNWFKEMFAPTLSYEELLQSIDSIEPGSNGLLFAPYLLGERTPHRDSHVRASFIGIDASHSFVHFVRSVLEGITFSLKDSQTLLADVADKSFTKIISIGGGAKNKDWLQMQADIFNADIVTLKVEEGPGMGAAMLAAVGLGWFADINECAQKFITYSEAIKPIKANVEQYKEIYSHYRKVYLQTKEL
ncbi:xylulokinase [Streptococcus marmotae]|uniref:xylulokinase n=1 Tax=Streptococcus marmotae TaxID=1825069 RepID=UPI0008336A04|nr:xylulokinase [Streptococcus marmotae]